jgi:hypothetical protein
MSVFSTRKTVRGRRITRHIEGRLPYRIHRIIDTPARPMFVQSRVNIISSDGEIAPPAMGGFLRPTPKSSFISTSALTPQPRRSSHPSGDGSAC